MLKKTVLILLALALIGSVVSLPITCRRTHPTRRSGWMRVRWCGSTGTAAKPFTTIQAAINKAADAPNALT